MKNTEHSEHPRACAFCERATPLHTGGQMLCPKKGVVDGGFLCRRFRYDPLKRIPHERPKLLTFSEEDMKL